MDILHSGNHLETHAKQPILDKYNKEAFELAKKAVWRRPVSSKKVNDSGEMTLMFTRYEDKRESEDDKFHIDR